MLGVIEIVAILIACAFSLYFYFKYSFKYWKNKSVPHIKPEFPWGTNGNPLRPKKGIQELFKSFYDEFKSQGNTFGGLYFFTKPAVLVVSPDLAKNVLAKDFQYFTGHGIHVDEEKEPISGNLFSLDGEKWKSMRVKLTPTFTSGKMKMMFHTILSCGDPMVDHINRLFEQEKPLNVKDVLACFTTDVIGSSAFGVECNSFKDPNAEFRTHGKQLFQSTAKSNFYRILNFIMPRLRLSAISEESKRFFNHIFTKIVNQRETSNYKRNDFVQLMLELKEKGDGLTMGQMLAQSVMFFAAGFETSSTAMTFCLHELSWNLDMQERLRKEINETMRKYDGKLTYDGVMEMKYLDMVLDETLRKYPPAGAIQRLCNKNYTIPQTDTVIEAGTRVFVSILGLHRDPEYYPDPDKFDPERFSDENKGSIRSYTYLPFGEGPRICIGLRFGVLQAKIGLCILLKNYIFKPHKTMVYKPDLHKTSQILSFQDDLLLMVERIQ